MEEQIIRREHRHIVVESDEPGVLIIFQRKKLRTKETMIGPPINSRKPMIHGATNR